MKAAAIDGGEVCREIDSAETGCLRGKKFVFGRVMERNEIQPSTVVVMDGGLVYNRYGKIKEDRRSTIG